MRTVCVCWRSWLLCAAWCWLLTALCGCGSGGSRDRIELEPNPKLPTLSERSAMLRAPVTVAGMPERVATWEDGLSDLPAVTISVLNQPWNQAVEDVARAAGLSASVEPRDI